MRFLFPLLTLLAVVLFALASLVSLALSFAVQSLDERLSREWLRDFGGSALPTEEFLRERPAARPAVAAGGGYVPTGMTPSGLELDVDRMKRKSHES